MEEKPQQLSSNIDGDAKEQNLENQNQDNQSVVQKLSDNVPQDQVKSKAKRKTPLELRKYTKQIWLAGLGAFSRAEEEGNKLFDSLVQVGEELEAKTTMVADQTVEKVGEVTGKAYERVVDTREKVEKIIDQHTHQTLNRFGIVTPKDILLIEQLLKNLNEKVDRLIDSNEQLQSEITMLKQGKK